MNVTSDVKNTDIRKEAEQLPVINAIFTPSPDAVAHAQTVAAARAASGTNTPVLNGHVVEAAMLREADRVLAIAEKLGSSSSSR